MRPCLSSWVKQTGESSGPGIPRTTQCQKMLLPSSAKDECLDAKRALWVTGCISHGLVHLTGSAVGLRGFLHLCLVPPLSAETRVCWWKLRSWKESWSSLQYSSPARFTKMALKVLFLCCWISSFPGREGTLRGRCESWLDSHCACLDTDGSVAVWFFLTLCSPGWLDELELPRRFQVPPSVPHKPHSPSRDALLWCCGSHCLYLLGEPVAALLLLRNKSWQLLFTRVWLFTANFLQFSSSCSPYPRTSVMYCLYFLLDSSPDCFLFSYCQFCTLPDLVRVLSSLTLFLKLLIFIL